MVKKIILCACALFPTANQGAMQSIVDRNKNINILSTNNNGNFNIAIGSSNLKSFVEGSINVGIGFGTLVGLKEGSDNLALGSSAGQMLKKGSSNIYIGFAEGVEQESGSIRIGNKQDNKQCYIAGINGAKSTGKERKVLIIDENNQITAVTFAQLEEMKAGKQ